MYTHIYTQLCIYTNFDNKMHIFDVILILQATSKLLVNYPKKYRDEILDYLFKVSIHDFVYMYHMYTTVVACICI